MTEALQHELTWGEQIEFLQNRAKLGKPTPAWDNWPLPFEDLEWAWDGWWYMHARRPVDQGGIRLITEQQMLAYCELFGVGDLDLQEAVEFYWPAMEVVYHEFEKAKRPTVGTPKVPSHPKNRRIGSASH